MTPLRLTKEGETSFASGSPWLYRGEIIESSELTLLPAGALVSVESARGKKLAVGYFNAASQISCRILGAAGETIDAKFFAERIKNALAKREKLVSVPYYRLVHAEADFLPGLLIDRFGDTLVIQVGTAGMERLQEHWLAALDESIKPKAIVLRNDIGSRKLEGLKEEVSVLRGEVPPLVEVLENGCVYFADLLKGQKTGWFFDQRDNRRLVAEQAKGKSVLDMYSHSGGFGLLAAKMGASEVIFADRSALALELAMKAAARNGVEKLCGPLEGEAFALMSKLAREGAKFDIVVADPPAFVKNKKDIAAGMKGYQKVARLAAALVKPGGTLFVASCSHHAARSRFNQAVLAGIKEAGRKGQILKETGAAPDHPRHPKLPQSEYLKAALLKLN